MLIKISYFCCTFLAIILLFNNKNRGGVDAAEEKAASAVDGEVRPTANMNTPNPMDTSREEEEERGLDARRERMRKALDASIKQMLNGFPAVDEGWCERMVDGNLEAREKRKLEGWEMDEAAAMMAEEEKKGGGEIVDKGCSRLRRLFPFHDAPLSEEERQFPLAYGLLVHKSPFQVFAMMSAIYQPQNAYCLVIDEKAEEEFKREMHLLADCLPNIFLMGSVGKIEWCKFGVTRAVFSCFKYLTELRHGWKYYQYLSGVDLPLKTNLEMVRIFKSLKGTVNMEVTRQDQNRLHDEIKGIKPPLTLWKSSLSALVSRQAANAMVKSEKVRRLMRYLEHAECSDESIWATIAGNPKELKIPGGFDAAPFFEGDDRCNKLRAKAGKKEDRGENLIKRNAMNGANGTIGEEAGEEQFHPANYYISRYQVWSWNKANCHGKMVKESCVFGIDDVPSLVRRPELIAHKMYLDYQPAAYFCLWKTIHERALDWRNQRKFRANAYSQLATVKAAIDGRNKKDPFKDDCHLFK